MSNLRVALPLVVALFACGPEPDLDNDGIPDERDKCPDKAETMNMLLDTDGCPDVAKGEFPLQIAQAACGWYFKCCDATERPTFNLQATSEPGCVTELSGLYTTSYSSADVSKWNGDEAQKCLDALKTATQSCPQAFNPAPQITACKMIEGTTPPGDSCTSQWQCTTKFCRMGTVSSGTCANPIKSGEPCVTGEPCAQGLSCVNGKCQGLQPDNASCIASQECFSGFCGNGKCQPNTSGFYGCDGKTGM